MYENLENELHKALGNVIEWYINTIKLKEIKWSVINAFAPTVQSHKMSESIAGNILTNKAE